MISSQTLHTPPTSSLAGWWIPGDAPPQTGPAALQEALLRLGQPVCVVEQEGAAAVATGGQVVVGGPRPAGSFPLRAWAPALLPQSLGDPEFRRLHGLRYAYVAGAMANGIASEDLVEAMARAGMMGFFGAAGLTPARVEAALDRLARNLGSLPYGSNLIHSPSEPALEAALADLYIRKGLRRVCASAYLDLTLPLIRYRVAGIHRGPDGSIVTPNRVIGKVSRTEVARKFFSPPPGKYLQALVAEGFLTPEQAVLAEQIPVAHDLTAEADSGGHTDNRPAFTLLPALLALRDEMQERFGYTEPLKVGAAGGIATPVSAAAAFAMGAAYVLTGSINQACQEAGTSDAVRQMLARAGPADVAMAPAADMFEMGVKVQVLKWGTLFPVRARKLYELYTAYDSLDHLPASQREMLERDYLRCSLEEAWSSTCRFFAERDPRQIERAQRDPKHKMALVFRSYLGLSSRWANSGEPTRQADYQIWCGPAMGAFNEWARGSFLEKVEERRVAPIALNLMVGAAYHTRLNWLRQQGLRLPAQVGRFAPRPPEELARLLAEAEPAALGE
jgi:PfaD family protein